MTVTIYTEKDTFIKRAANMAANYDNSDTNKNNRIKYVTGLICDLSAHIAPRMSKLY